MASFLFAPREGRRGLVAGGALGVAAVLVLPLALAWACVPGAAIGFDRASAEYRAGEVVTVLGRKFAPSTEVSLVLYPPSEPPRAIGNGVSTDADGRFTDTFALPSSAAPGAYVVVASVTITDVDGHGRTYEAREAFEVLAPPAVTDPTPPPAVTDPTPPPLGPAPIGPTLVDERVRPNMIRPGLARAVQRGRRIVVRVRGKMIGNRGRRCGGRLKIGTRAGLRRAATQTGRMGRDCGYAKRYSFPVRRVPPRLRPRNKKLVLRILIRYQGNSLLKGDLSPPKRVEVQRR